MEIWGFSGIVGVSVPILGTFATVLTIIIGWKSDRKIQERIGNAIMEGQKEITTGVRAIIEGQKEITRGVRAIMEGQERIAQMLLNQTRILEKMEARMGT